MMERHLSRAVRALFRPQDNQGIVDIIRTCSPEHADAMLPFYIHVYVDPPGMSLPAKLKRDRAASSGVSDPRSGYVRFRYYTMLCLCETMYRAARRPYSRLFIPVESKLVKGDLFQPPFYAVYDVPERAKEHLQHDIERYRTVLSKVSETPSLLYCIDFYPFSKRYLSLGEDPYDDFVSYITLAIDFASALLKCDLPRVVWQVTKVPTLLIGG